MPALVITPPVTARARRMPCFGAVLDRLLAGAGDQEDVVVDAERDEEDEGEERQRRVRAGEAEDDVEDEVADPEGRQEAEDHGADQDQRRDHRAQQADQDQEDDEEDDRRDHDRVPAGRVADVEFDRGRAADEGAGGRVVGRVADRFDQVEGLGRVGVRFERRLDQGPGRPFGDRAGRPPRRRRPRPPTPRTAGTSARFWDDDVGQRGGARGEALVEQVLAFDRFDFGAVAVFAGQVGREEGEAAAEDQQDGERAAPMTRRGEIATRSPTRAQKPWVASAACSSRWRRIS